MNKALKVTLKVLNYIIVILVLILAFLLVGIKILGFDIYTVLSGSMEPNYHVGALVYVKEQPSEDLKKGDTITFFISDKTTATHRIVEIVSDEETNELVGFKTKGDANENVDANIVKPEKIVGKVVWTIPYLGFLAAFIQTKKGGITLLIVGVIIVALMCVSDIFIEDKKEKKKNTKKS